MRFSENQPAPWITGWTEAERLTATIIEGGSIDSDTALVTAMPCQAPAASPEATTDTLAATGRMLARNVSRNGLATSEWAVMGGSPGLAANGVAGRGAWACPDRIHFSRTAGGWILAQMLRGRASGLSQI
ncbi:hypothetical protein PDE01_14530 [Paracoccus denitrificans]|nr:hypothetical protein PDE01_14530 [Paracoccus denitrificans]